MGQIPDLQAARLRLGLALEVVRHDRWVAGTLRDGRFKPVAASESTSALMHSRSLTALARRSLYERRPLAVTSLIEDPMPPDGYDWELDWPSILYVPIGEAERQPVGLLVIGCRRDHWYSEEDIAYARTIGVLFAKTLADLAGPLGRLTDRERQVVQLISEGFSVQEVARATRTDSARAQRVVDRVVQKLDLKSLRQLPQVLPDRPLRIRGIYL